MMTEKKFEESCKEELLKFLENYSSRKKHFNQEQLERVKDINPQFFEKRSNEDSGGVFIQWHYDDGLLLMAGLKTDVERKETEILRTINITAPKYVLFNLFRFYDAYSVKI